MSLLQPATGGSYLKAGFLGFTGSGKTHTAVELALGAREFFKLAGPIAMFDTEKGSDYWAGRIEARTGQKLLVVKSRSLADLIATGRECLQLGVSVLIADSITHVWREVCSAYLQQRMAKHREKHYRHVSDKLEFQDWGRIKEAWQVWPDWYLDSPLHVIVCGRAGWDYEMEKDEDGKNELIKSGIKMKVEGEFGFEPSLLVEMQREFVTDKHTGQVTDQRAVVNRAIILKDRYNLLDGRMVDNPTFDFFRPHVELLAPGNHSTIDTQQRTQFSLDAEGRGGWERERENREIAAEKVKSAFALVDLDGQSADAKKARADAMREYWGTTSWKELSERLPAAEIMRGLDAFAIAKGLRDPDPPETGGSGDDDVNHLVAAPEAAAADSDAPKAAS